MGIHVNRLTFCEMKGNHKTCDVWHYSFMSSSDWKLYDQLKYIANFPLMV